MKPVIYDEVEAFSNNNSYPFQPRKSNIPSVFYNRADDKNPIYTINLMKSRVCINDDIMSELLFWRPDKCEIEDNSRFDYQKIKLGKT